MNYCRPDPYYCTTLLVESTCYCHREDPEPYLYPSTYKDCQNSRNRGMDQTVTETVQDDTRPYEREREVLGLGSTVL